MLRKTNTFDPVYFLYAFLHASLKRKPQRGHRWTTFFQSSDEKVTCLTPTQIKILGIFEKQRIKLDTFVKFLKKKHFLHFTTIIIFFYFILQFLKECDTFKSNSVSFFLSYSLKPTNTCFVSTKVISDRDLETIHQPSMKYWFQYCE